MIGIGAAAVVEVRIAETIAADAGRCRLALLHVTKAAAGHVSRDVPATKLAGAGLWRGHRSKRDRRNEYRGGGGYCLQTLSHRLACVPSRCLVLFEVLLSLGAQVGCE